MSHHAEAVIVAGGFGTRLLPLTARRPKHLLNVGGVPFLEHQIARLAEAGVDHVVLATSYRAELFEPVLGDGSRWGVRLDYVQEEEPLGTAGALAILETSYRATEPELRVLPKEGQARAVRAGVRNASLLAPQDYESGNFAAVALGVPGCEGVGARQFVNR